MRNMKNHHANVRSDQKQNLKMVRQGKKNISVYTNHTNVKGVCKIK